MNKKAWIKSGNSYSQFNNIDSIIPELTPGVYNLCFDEQQGRTYVERFADKFVFDFKIYGLETDFLNFVIKSYESSTGNMGVLFNGYKGGGKSVCAKILANQLNLPVIIVNRPIPTLASFITGLNSDCVLFFDEFEKTFNDRKDNDHTNILLSVMDGVYNSEYRKVFLLTTNQLMIDSNFLSRPSRIRFKREFKNISLQTVKEYIADNLLYKEFTNDIIDFINSLTMSTIDILKTIVNEVNIHQIPPQKFKDYLNLEFSPYRFNAYTLYASSDTQSNFTEDEIIEFLLDRKNPNFIKKFSGYTSISTRVITCNKNPEFIKPGDEIYDSEVIEVDHKKMIFKLRYDADNIMYIKLLDYQTPSLYAYTNGYYNSRNHDGMHGNIMVGC